MTKKDTEVWEHIGGDLEASTDGRYVKIRVRGKDDYIFLSEDSLMNAVNMIRSSKVKIK